MNRLLTMTSGGLFAATLVILPISAFAQQTATDAKTATPVVTAPTAATVTAPAKPQAVTKHATATKAAAKHALPTGTTSTSTMQPKIIEQSKS